MFSRVLVTAALLLGMGSVAEAGVAGNTFAGTITNRSGETGTLCLQFGDSGTWTLSRQFAGDANALSFQGSFVETDLVLFSFFSGNIGRRQISGFQILGAVTLNVAGNGGGLAAQGTAFQSGGCDIVPGMPVSGDVPHAANTLPPLSQAAAREERTSLTPR